MGLQVFTYKKQFVAQYTVEAGDKDSTGYAEISSTPTAFVGATVPAITSATYDLDVNTDGSGNNQLAIALLDSDDWDGIAAKIQTALRTATSGTEVVAVVDGAIRITSDSEGATSTVVIAAGTAGSGGGDLLTAIDGLAGYTTALETPVDGTEGSIAITIDSDAPNKESADQWDLLYTIQVRDSSGVEKTSSIIATYDKTTGILTVADNTTVGELNTDDVVTVNGALVEL